MRKYYQAVGHRDQPLHHPVRRSGFGTRDVSNDRLDVRDRAVGPDDPQDQSPMRGRGKGAVDRNDDSQRLTAS
jgi:hypothetical protein